MKRGLKDHINWMFIGVNMFAVSVTTVTPMKRGLKALPSYNRYPEKGDCRTLRQSVLPVVTTVTPMKRGLKAANKPCRCAGKQVTTVTPMKRGLKVELLVAVRCQRPVISYNRYPDEKGTESEAESRLVTQSNRYG